EPHPGPVAAPPARRARGGRLGAVQRRPRHPGVPSATPALHLVGPQGRLEHDLGGRHEDGLGGGDGAAGRRGRRRRRRPPHDPLAAAVGGGHADGVRTGGDADRRPRPRLPQVVRQPGADSQASRGPPGCPLRG
ncbi:MAG: hypothetical protein AVDCRST_MAG20-1816, partial [uncultured Acidimicrobiales bacterium]